MSFALYDYPGGQIYLDLDEGDYAHRMKAGTWEPNLVRVMLAELKREQMFVDIGAHVGYYALWAAKLVGERGAIFAFEMDADNWGYLSDAALLNRYFHCYPFRYAVGQTDYTSIYRVAECSTLHRLLPSVIEGESVPVIGIDLFWQRHSYPLPDMVKIDVEGAELGVLEGMQETINKCEHLTLLLNIHPDYGVTYPMLTERLTPQGFVLERQENGNEVVARKGVS